jgi:hypothetical protein
MNFWTFYIKYKVQNYIPSTGSVFNGHINITNLINFKENTPSWYHSLSAVILIAIYVSPSSLPCSHKPATGPYIKPHKGKPHPTCWFHVILHLCLDLPSGLLSQVSRPQPRTYLSVWIWSVTCRNRKALLGKLKRKQTDIKRNKEG